MAQTRPGERLAQQAMAFVLAGGRGSRLMELTDKRAKPAVFFGGKSRIIDFALSNAVNSGIRRIAVATQYKAHSLIRHLQRGWSFLRAERNEFLDILPASQRIDGEGWYRGTADAVTPEHRHHRRLRPRLHGRARRRPRLQDGLREDAAAARRVRRRRHRRLPDGAARRGLGLRRDGRRRAPAHHRLPGKACRPARPAGRSGQRARQHGHLRLRLAVPARAADRGRAGRELQPRFRQGPDPAAGRARARRWRTASPIHAS